MSKYLFLQKEGMPWHSIMSISATLKQNPNNIVDLILVDIEKRPMEWIKKFNPDYALFPVLTGEAKWVQSFADNLKQELPNVKTVFGGVHATLYPETLRADFIVRGEADYLERFIRSNKMISPYQEDVTQLPQPDRSIYYKYPHLAKASSKQFITARGCNFNCSFCSGHMYHKLFPKMPRVRRRNPEQVIAEIYDVRSKWGLKSVSFTDDVFTLSPKDWLPKFLDMYKHEIKLPFICNTRFDIINAEFLGMLKDAGCYGLEMGIESGSLRIRKEILNKGAGTNETILKAGRLIKSAGFKLKTYNIIGIPTETLEDAFQTVELNSRIKADQTSCSFMTPFKGYDIAKYYPSDVQLTDSIYRPMSNLSKEIINLQTFFLIATKFPFLIPVIKGLIKLPPNRLFRLMALFIYGLFMAKVHKLTIGDIWRYRKLDTFKI